MVEKLKVTFENTHDETLVIRGNFQDGKLVVDFLPLTEFQALVQGALDIDAGYNPPYIIKTGDKVTIICKREE
jgi:hypothetical protein